MSDINATLIFTHCKGRMYAAPTLLPARRYTVTVIPAKAAARALAWKTNPPYPPLSGGQEKSKTP